jgi:microcystin-dependent protein
MADVTISELTNRQPNSSAVFPYSEGGVTYNATLNQIIPTGVIMMWSGSIASVPSGWALCNGTNGTPNLVDRFVVGAGVTTPAVGTTGGSKDAIVVSHTHTATDSGHTHSGVLRTTSSSPSVAGGSSAWLKEQNSNTGYANITVSTEGQSGTNANMPPYYALAYIMKL